MKVPIPRGATRIAACATLLVVTAVAFDARMAFAQAPAPVTAADAKEYDAAEQSFKKGDFKDAAARFEKFLEKYKMLSPRSLDAKFRLAVSYVQQAQYEDATRHLRDLIANPKVEVAAKEMAQLLIAKSLTLRGFKMPTESEPLKQAQKAAFGEAIKEYDVFLATYPKSRDVDSAHFLRATLLLQTDSFDAAANGFGTVTRFTNSPFVWEAVMWVGKTYFIQAGSLLEIKGGKEPKPDAVQQAMTLFDKAQPMLEQTYRSSGDLALQNEAVFFAGQMLLTRSQYVTAPDEDQQKQKQAVFLNGALEAFRAVRSVDEVLDAQDAKIKYLEQQITLLKPGTADYMAFKNRLENLIDHEEEKKDKYKTGQDQGIAARLAIARIFVFLKKTDEARSLIRYLQARKDLLEKDKEAQATLASLLCLTYAEQKKSDKALETYQEFRKDFKGNIIGDNLPLLVANALVDQNKPDEAEKIVQEGMDDYKNWRFATDSTQVLTAAALKRGDYAKALDLCNKMLATTLKPETEAQTLFLKGSVQQAKGLESQDAALAADAVKTYKVLRDKFPKAAQSEEAWFNECQILVSTEPAKAVGELETFLAKFTSGEAKSGNTKANLPVAQYLLGTVLEKIGQSDKAVQAWRKLIDAYPDSEPAPGAFFKIFDVYNGKKDYPRALKMMEDFLGKYPLHENVFYAYNSVAEILFSGVMEGPAGSPGKPVPKAASALVNVEAGVKKLYEYVDYELSKKLKVKRGDGSLIKIAGRWVKELSKLPPYLTQNPDQRATFEKSVDGATAAIERLLKDYGDSERLSEGLELLVSIQGARRKAQLTDPAQVESYFKDLVGKYGSQPLTKAKIDVALAAFLYDVDMKRSAAGMEEAFRAVPEPVKVPDPAGGPAKVVATFTPNDFDRYLSGLFVAKRYDEIAKVVSRLRLEYPFGEKDDPAQAAPSVREAQAVAYFWEGKVLLEQNNPTEALAKFSALKEKFPKSPKALEADYGVILGEFEKTQQVKDDYVKRLQAIIKAPSGKSFELQAKALFLIGRLYEARKDFDAAVDTYKKIHAHYASVPKIAAEGLWRAAQIADKQAKNDAAYPVKTAKERRAAAEARAAAAAKLEETKPADTKPAGNKPAGDKPDDAKPEKPPVKTAAAEAPAQK